MFLSLQFFLSCLIVSCCISTVRSKIVFDFAQTKTCPSVPITAHCNRKYDPVICGASKCIYSNECFAKSASSEFDESSCCPYNGNAICPQVYLPVVCSTKQGRQCVYSNECEATSSLSKEWNCSQIEEENHEQETTCPVVNEEIRSRCEDRKRKNITCGNSKCNVENICTAKLLGWKRKDCTKANGCPFPRHKKCKNSTEVRETVYCGENECRYYSMCLAATAGYEEGDCKKA